MLEDGQGPGERLSSEVVENAGRLALRGLPLMPVLEYPRWPRLPRSRP